MIKKLGIVTAVVATLSLGVAGAAYAGDYDGDGHKSHHKSHKKKGTDDNGTDCRTHENTEQSNKGKQLIGGNVDVKNITGFIGGTADKVAICPSVGNNSDFSLQ